MLGLHHLKGIVQSLQDFVDLGRGGDQRRSQAEGVVQFAEAAAGLADDHALLHAFAHHGSGRGFGHGS